jgi:N6-adenosine-specific RNA methylase IME4
MRYPLLLVDWPWAYNNKRTGGSMKSGSFDAYKAGADGKPTLTIEDGLAMRPLVDAVTYDTTALFAWGTKPLLKDALRLFEGWGFEYKTFVGWDKARYGLGFWFRGQEEMLFVFVRPGTRPFRSQERDVQEGAEAYRENCILECDSPSYPPTDHEYAQCGCRDCAAVWRRQQSAGRSLEWLLKADAIITEKRGAHSAKPAWQYDLVGEARRHEQDRCLELFARPNNIAPCWVDQTGLELDGLDVRDALRLAAGASDRSWTSTRTTQATT